MRRGRALLGGAALSAVLLAAPPAADERYALIVSGASGGQNYAKDYERWTTRLLSSLRTTLRFRDENVIVLAETAGSDTGRATGEGVRRAIGTLHSRMTKDSLLLVVLIGHGTFDGVDAKFNLVGPDLEAREWAELFRTLPGRLVVVNTTGASFPFLERLATEGRVVVSATDSPAQRFDTIFPEFFVQAFDDASGDLDKDKRVSVWEAFAAASLRVRQWYEQRGQLPTERPVLDDTGDGMGKEAGQPGPDGTLARRTFLDSAPESTAVDPAVALLLDTQARLVQQVEALKARKDTMPSVEYERELERLLVELARVSREIRSKSE